MNFFQQFQRLRERTPRLSLRGFKNVNSDYCDFAYFAKNSYMCFTIDQSESCYYVMRSYKCKFCADSYMINDCELCYECINCANCYDSSYLQDCQQTSESFLGYDLKGCNKCFGCINLRHQQYHIWNKPYEKEQYELEVSRLKKIPLVELYKEFEKLHLTVPHVQWFQNKTENAIGDHLKSCKNAFYCWDSEGVQDCAYLFRCFNVYGNRTMDSYDSSGGVDMEMSYEVDYVGKIYNCNFCFYCEFLRDSEYCDHCFNSEHLFGCVGLSRRKYCILNQEFEPEEWQKRVDEIKAEMRASGEYAKWPDEWKMSEVGNVYEFE